MSGASYCEMCQICRQMWPIVSANVGALLRGSHPLRTQNILRCLTTQTQVTEQKEKTVKKKRDRLTVLKVLSSTVENLPNKPDYRFFDDTILNPRSLMKQKELFLALESGKKAAEHILEKHSDLFPLRQPVPEWPTQSKFELVEDSIENLELLITTAENTTKVLDIYESLKAQGDLTIDVHNKVLDFASFHALPGSVHSQEVQDTDDTTSQDTSSSSSSSSSSEDEGAGIENASEKSTWRSNGYAESLFSELKVLGNANTYEVFILGLLKHGEYIRAFHLFKEFDEKNMKGSLFFYNSLSSHVCDVRQQDNDRWGLVKEIVGSMKKTATHPDVVTFNNLLAIAVQLHQDEQVLCQSLMREMKKLKISPSLGSYYYILQSERKKDKQDLRVLMEIISDLKKGVADLELRHPADILFFHSAMDLARFKRHGTLAQEILAFVLDNGLQHFLGGKQSSFFGNYLCAVARNAPSIATLFVEYERIVPKYVIPRDWVYQQLLFACRNHKDPGMVPRLYSDMVSMRVPLTERVAYALYAAMDDNIPKEDAEKFLEVVKDSTKWMEIFKVDMTADVLSTSIKVLSLNEQYDDARSLMDDAKKRNMLPSVDAIRSVVELALNQKDKEAAMNTIKYLSENKLVLEDKTRKLINEHELLAEKRDKILSWFEK